MSVPTRLMHCATKNCNNSVEHNAVRCRVCADDHADQCAPAIWDGVTKVSTHEQVRTFTLVCINCGTLDSEPVLSEAEVRRWAVAAPAGDCNKCHGFLVLEALTTGLMETTAHLRPPTMSRSADLKGTHDSTR